MRLVVDEWFCSRVNRTIFFFPGTLGGTLKECPLPIRREGVVEECIKCTYVHTYIEAMLLFIRVVDTEVMAEVVLIR